MLKHVLLGDIEQGNLPILSEGTRVAAHVRLCDHWRANRPES
jgi:hypothetical protein